MHWIDTHCHLYANEFDADRTLMINRAIEAGIDKMMLPNIDESSIQFMDSLVNEFPGHCYAMMGLHPGSVKEDYKPILDRMEALIHQGQYVGVGETGIDLYWDVTYKEQQIDAFRIQIQWGKELDLPVIIHSRESLDLNISIIAEEQDGRLKGIFHCFGGTEEQAKSIYDLGFKVGIGGTVTYKNSTLSSVLPKIPTSMIVLETDSPYLAPVPFRGKRNESANLTLVGEKVAEILGISAAELASMTTDNAREVFGKKG